MRKNDMKMADHKVFENGVKNARQSRPPVDAGTDVVKTRARRMRCVLYVKLWIRLKFGTKLKKTSKVRSAKSPGNLKV